MKQILVIAEKPKVAAQIAAALSRGFRQKGSEGVSYYELERDGAKITVAAAVGHIYTLAEKKKSSGYPVFDIEWVPAFEQSKESAFTKKYLVLLKKLAKAADEIYSACDYDIEGSLIAGNIIRQLAPGKPAKRMLYSSLVPNELEEAFVQAGPLDTSSIDAGEARHILDWYWGINVSRALMAAIKKAGRFKVLSVGRVQGPALSLLAKREREIEAFKPEPYWQVFAKAKDVLFTHERDRFPKEPEAQAALADAQSAKEGEISKLEVKKFEQPPGVPFDLTTLQVEAYRCFGFSPSHTLDLAQDLYEAAIISYPRTSSQKLPAKLNFPKLFSMLKQQPVYGLLVTQLESRKRFLAREGPKTDSAHVSIYPTGVKPSALGEMQGKLYDLIVRRFLSCFAESAQRESVRARLQVANQGFQANGIRTLQPGWAAFYGHYTPLEEQPLPPLKEGERLPVQKVWDERKETKPPKRFTAASIIRELEKHKLGTKATRSAVIDTLYNRNYLSDRKSIRVTPLGLSVDEALSTNVPEIVSEQLTRQFEGEMDGIQQGRQKQAKVISGGRAALEKILAEFSAKELQIGQALSKGVSDLAAKQSTLGACNVCKEGQLVLKTSKYGLFAACNRYPACKNTFSVPKNALIQAVGKACEFCGLPVIRVIRKGKRPFEMCLTSNCKSKEGWVQRKPYPPKKVAAKPGPAAKTESTPAKADSPTAKPAKPAKPSAKPPSAPETEPAA